MSAGAIVLLIISIAAYGASLAALYLRGNLAPVAGFAGLLFMWLSGALPLNGSIVAMWLCITLIVVCIGLLQPPAVRSSRVGAGYMALGGIAAMAVGLLGFTFARSLSMLHGIMVVATLAGVVFGYMLFSNTPAGRNFRLGRPGAVAYLLAKGFPVAIALMELGVTLVVLLAVNNVDRLQGV